MFRVQSHPYCEGHKVLDFSMPFLGKKMENDTSDFDLLFCAGGDSKILLSGA